LAALAIAGCGLAVTGCDDNPLNGIDPTGLGLCFHNPFGHDDCETFVQLTVRKARPVTDWISKAKDGVSNACKDSSAGSSCWEIIKNVIQPVGECLRNPAACGIGAVDQRSAMLASARHGEFVDGYCDADMRWSMTASRS
jgi:hypothetical protein